MSTNNCQLKKEVDIGAFINSRLKFYKHLFIHVSFAVSR